jgi:outer membrane protein assembly factor BamB
MKRVLVVLALACVAVDGCTWLRKIGTGKDNVEPPKALVEFAPSVGVQTLWTESGSGAGKSGARISPAVADGRVYVAGVDGTIEALDAATGNSVWTRHEGRRAGGWIRQRENSQRWTGGPAVAGDLLVVGGLDGQVRAFSSADGSPRWEATTSSEVIAAPAIADGIVVVRADDGRVSGFDAADGSRKWVYEQSVPPLSQRGNSAPRIDGGAVYVAFDNGKVMALGLADGNPLWAQNLATGEGRTEVERLSDADGPIAIDGGALFVASYRGQIAALALDSGRPQWQRELSSYAGVAVDARAVVTVDADGNVWAFDRGSGANLWKQDALQYRWLGAPAIQGSCVVVGDFDGYVHWLSLEDGKLAARERLGKKPIESAPVVVDGVAYVEDVEGRLGAYALR